MHACASSTGLSSSFKICMVHYMQGFNAQAIVKGGITEVMSHFLPMQQCIFLSIIMYSNYIPAMATPSSSHMSWSTLPNSGCFYITYTSHNSKQLRFSLYVCGCKSVWL